MTPGQLFDDTLALWSRLALTDELESLRPWLVSQSLMPSLVPELGFDFAHGVDRMVKARTRGRALFSLEAAGVPLQFMADAPVAEQISGMARVVQQPLEVKGELQSVVNGWRNRDVDELSAVAIRAHQQAPLLSAGLFGARNRAWMPHLLRFARSSKPTVAVVGVLHMVGPDSLVDLFGAAGFRCELV